MTSNLVLWDPPEPLGETFDAARDGKRLAAQARRVLAATLGRGWRNLGEIARETGDPEASVSARLRDIRRAGFRVERKYQERGLWLYQVVKEIK